MPKYIEGERVVVTDESGVVTDSYPLEGASARDRAVFGAAVTPEDRLATVRRKYPRATQRGDRIYFEDEQGRTRIVNPPGLDWGDIPGVSREIAEGVGAAGGAAAGFVAGLPVGGVGSIPGAAAGAATGGLFGQSMFDYFANPVDTRSLPKKMYDQAITAGTNAVGEGGGRAAVEAINQFPGAEKAADALQRLTDFRGAGITPTPGAVVGDTFPTVGRMEETYSWMPASTEAVAPVRAAQLQETQGAAEDIARQLGTPAESPGVAGVRLREGISENMGELGREAKRQFADVVSRFGDDPVPLDNLRTLYADLVARYARDPDAHAHLAPIIERMRPVAERGAMRADDLETFRKSIGEGFSQPDNSGRVLSNVGDTRNALYGAVRSDLGEEAGRRGFGEAYEAQKAYASDLIGNVTPASNAIIGKKGDVAPGLVYRRLLGAGKDSANQLERFKRTMDADTFRDFAATMTDQMGKATPGAQDAGGDVFSVATFVTNWNRLDDGAKRVLFGDRFEDLERLSRVAGSMKNMEKHANNSRTAIQSYMGNLVTGGGLGFTSGVGGLMDPSIGTVLGMAGGLTSLGVGHYAIPKIGSKIIMNPKFLQFMTGTMPGKGTDLAGHMGRLMTESVNWNLDDRERAELETFLAPFRQSDVPVVPGAEGAGLVPADELTRALAELQG